MPNWRRTNVCLIPTCYKAILFQIGYYIMQICLDCPLTSQFLQFLFLIKLLIYKSLIARWQANDKSTEIDMINSFIN